MLMLSATAVYKANRSWIGTGPNLLLCLRPDDTVTKGIHLVQLTVTVTKNSRVRPVKDGRLHETHPRNGAQLGT